MKYQQTNWTCGPAATCNALQLWGVRASEARLARLAGTLEATGTSPMQMFNLFLKLGLKVNALISPKKDRAFKWLKKARAPIIVLVMNGRHWVTIISKNDKYLVIADSSTTKYNISENGIRVLDQKEFMKFWRWKKGGRNKYVGFEISK